MLLLLCPHHSRQRFALSMPSCWAAVVAASDRRRDQRRRRRRRHGPHLKRQVAVDVLHDRTPVEPVLLSDHAADTIVDVVCEAKGLSRLPLLLLPPPTQANLVPDCLLFLLLLLPSFVRQLLHFGLRGAAAAAAALSPSSSCSSTGAVSRMPTAIHDPTDLSISCGFAGYAEVKGNGGADDFEEELAVVRVLFSPALAGLRVYSPAVVHKELKERHRQRGAGHKKAARGSAPAAAAAVSSVVSRSYFSSAIPFSRGADDRQKKDDVDEAHHCLVLFGERRAERASC